MQRLDPAPLPSPPNTIETSPLDWPVSEAVGRVPQLLPVLGKLADTAHSHVVLRGPDDSERCFGPTSLWWLSSNFGELLRESVCRAGLDEHGIVTQDAFSLANEKMRQLLRNEESAGPRPPRDGSSLTSPPHVILEALMDPYFDTINPYFPIWTKKRFQHLVQRSKEGLDAAHERGFAVCANNLVILTLTAKVLQSRAGNQPAGATSQMGSSTDSDLLKTFVRSAHRAFSNVEQLLRPTLINIQALLSLVGSPLPSCPSSGAPMQRRVSSPPANYWHSASSPSNTSERSIAASLSNSRVKLPVPWACTGSVALPASG